MKIGIVQRDDTRNVLSSSGTIYSMSQSLERHVGEVVHLGPDSSLASKAMIRGGQVFNRLSEAPSWSAHLADPPRPTRQARSEDIWEPDCGVSLRHPVRTVRFS